jgi:hypothetical protein
MGELARFLPDRNWLQLDALVPGKYVHNGIASPHLLAARVAVLSGRHW